MSVEDFNPTIKYSLLTISLKNVLCFNKIKEALNIVRNHIISSKILFEKKKQ